MDTRSFGSGSDGGWGVRGSNLGKIEVTKTEAHRSVLALWSFSLLCSRRNPPPCNSGIIGI